MKILSVTQNDGRVIEMSNQEFREFCILAKAVEGKEYGEVVYGDFAMHGLPRENSYFDESVGEQFEFVFGAIRAFYLALFRANEMQKLVTGFYAAIRAQKEG